MSILTILDINSEIMYNEMLYIDLFNFFKAMGTKMKSVYILRGLPGSGKTHLASSMKATNSNMAVVSADDYFMKDGAYQFDPRDLPQAHACCIARFLEHISAGKNVVVDNVHSRIWEYQNYITIALLFGYEVSVLEIECPDQETLERFQARNVHGVPLFSMERMWTRWEYDQRAKTAHLLEVTAV